MSLLFGSARNYPQFGLRWDIPGLIRGNRCSHPGEMSHEIVGQPLICSAGFQHVVCVCVREFHGNSTR